MRTGILWCVLIAGVGLVFSGCAGVSPPPTYYLLGQSETLKPIYPALANLSIGVGPVTVPGHLDRPQIVTRTGRNTIAVSEFHRWGEALEHQLRRRLAMNLSALLQTPGVVIYPWERAMGPRYQVVVTVLEFGDTNDGAELDAVWQLMDVAADKCLMTRRFSIVTSVEGPGVDAYVTAQSVAFEAFTREIAKGIFELASAQNPPGN